MPETKSPEPTGFRPYYDESDQARGSKTEPWTGKEELVYWLNRARGPSWAPYVIKCCSLKRGCLEFVFRKKKGWGRKRHNVKLDDLATVWRGAPSTLIHRDRSPIRPDEIAFLFLTTDLKTRDHAIWKDGHWSAADENIGGHGKWPLRAKPDGEFPSSEDNTYYRGTVDRLQAMCEPWTKPVACASWLMRAPGPGWAPYLIRCQDFDPKNGLVFQFHRRGGWSDSQHLKTAELHDQTKVWCGPPSTLWHHDRKPIAKDELAFLFLTEDLEKVDSKLWQAGNRFASSTKEGNTGGSGKWPVRAGDGRVTVLAELVHYCEASLEYLEEAERAAVRTMLTTMKGE